MNDAFYEGLRRERDSRPRSRRIELADRLLRSLNPVQLNVFQDTARNIGILTPGQAGKTTLSGRLIADTLLRKPRALVAYVSLTQKVAKRYLWEPLSALSKDYGLEFEPHATDGYIRAPDGGMCVFGGIESTADVERYRGTPWDLFILDETKSADQRLVKTLVEEVLPPRLANRNGRLVLSGTPGAVLHGTFFNLTGPASTAIRIEGGKRIATSRPYRKRGEAAWQDVIFEWSLHRWSLAENAAAPHLWERALERKKAKGWSDDNPIWLREYMGEWVADETNRLYRFDPSRNLWTPGKTGEAFGLPRGHDWNFVIGVDFGHSDPCAIITIAYSDTHPDLFQVAEFNERGLSYAQQAAAIRRAQLACGERLIATVADPARKGIVESLRIDHGVYVQSAEKREKRDAVELVSADMFEGRVKVLKGSTLEGQAASLQWDETGLKDLDQVNDCSDAFLYASRKAHHRMADAPPVGAITPAEHREALMAAELDSIQRQQMANDEDAFGEVADVSWDEDEW